MKLLLTSNGISNPSIEKALRELVDSDIKTAFIPTAANYSGNDKGWLINDMVRFQKLGFITIVDIAALSKEEWLPRLQQANVIVLGGGQTKYLHEKMKESGLDKELPELLKTRVFVGISAGSIFAGERTWGASENLFTTTYEESPEGLGFTVVNFRPHYKSTHQNKNTSKPAINKENLEKATKDSKHKLYACDDNTAIKIVDNEVEIISEGEWEIFPEQN